MKQVLLVATVGGFVPQFELNNVKLLRELGCNIHYAANFDYSVYSVTDELLTTHGIIKHQLDIAKSPFNLKANYHAYKKLKEIIDKNNIQLVHCHTPVGGLVARLAAAASHSKPKVVYTAHGFHFYKGAPIINWCAYYLVERFLARKTDVIVTINQEDYNRACEFNLRNGGKVYKIPGVGLNLERFRKNDNLDARKDKAEFTGDRPDSIKLVTVAELNKNKNHQVVIKALASLGRDDIYYDIYGEGPYKQHLSKLICELNMEKYIKIRGYIKEPEVILRKADIFVFPSIREGLGMAALEAMASGIPVIAKDNRGTREYMKNENNGLICIQGTVKEYGQAISRLADSKEERMVMGRNAIVTAEKFALKHTEETMRVVYSTLV